MPEMPPWAGSAVQTIGSVPASSSGTVIVSSGSVDTKGSTVELIAATEHEANLIVLQLTAGSVGDANTLYQLDLKVGSAPETIILPDLIYKARYYYEIPNCVLLPIATPKGTRVSAAVSASSGASALIVSLQLYSAPLFGTPSRQRAERYLPATYGVNVDPGGTAHTDSAWVQLTAATVRAHGSFLLVVHGGDASLASTGQHWLIDIGIGGAGSEVVWISDIYVSANSVSDFNYVCYIPIPRFLPVATRVAVRARGSSIVDGDRDIFVALYGF